MAKQKNRSEQSGADEKSFAGRNLANDLPAYFLSLSLENVRCFGPEQTLDLSDGNGRPARWTVILGLNGTGKTTILQSIAGLKESPYARRPGETRMMCRLFPFRDWVVLKSFVRGETEEACWRIKIAYANTLAASPVHVSEGEYQVRSRDSGESVASAQGIYQPWCCAYGAGRRVGTAPFGDSGPDDPPASLFSDKEDLRNPEEWLLRLDYAASKPSDLQDQQTMRLAQVKDLLLSILPEVEDIRLTSSSGPLPTSRAEFKTPYGWVPLRQLGYGYQTLITWVADLANWMVERYADSSTPLAEPAVVAVDEIDLHLHPLWQRKLMDFLTERFPNTQFIVTAHSPLVAQAAADANLVVLRREEDHVVIDNDVDNIRGWRIDQILTSGLFGLASARPPEMESLLAERRELLTKPKLNVTDKRRLAEIEEKIGELPTGETAQEVKEKDEIRKTLDLLMKERRTAR